MIIFPDLPTIEVEEVTVAEEIILTLRTTAPTAVCPSCGVASSRVQSRYTRTLRDRAFRWVPPSSHHACAPLFL